MSHDLTRVPGYIPNTTYGCTQCGDGCYHKSRYGQACEEVIDGEVCTGTIMRNERIAWGSRPKPPQDYEAYRDNLEYWAGVHMDANRRETWEIDYALGEQHE